MTTTIAGVKISDTYRAALELDKPGSYYARLYVTSESGKITTEAENHYGKIDGRKAKKRFYSQVKRWIKQI